MSQSLESEAERAEAVAEARGRVGGTWWHQALPGGRLMGAVVARVRISCCRVERCQ
jgi:cation diffusion facilitator CzcD-associated flavoprotein CzcO